MQRALLDLTSPLPTYQGFPGSSDSKDLPSMWEAWVWSQEDPLEKGMAIPSSILAWKIPQTEEAGGLQSMESESDTTEQLTLSPPTHQPHSHTLFQCILYFGNKKPFLILISEKGVKIPWFRNYMCFLFLQKTCKFSHGKKRFSDSIN